MPQTRLCRKAVVQKVSKITEASVTLKEQPGHQPNWANWGEGLSKSVNENSVVSLI